MFLKSKLLKNFLISLLILILADLTLTRCANPRSPTGGPKDTIPPVLVTSIPITGSTNFNEQEITLEFSEYVNADKLTQNLIITPKTEIRFKHIIKRNQLLLKFEEPFPDTTTFSLNFFDGVTDITEKNPAVNLIVAFSTGPTIDSMQISGRVKDRLSDEPSKNFIVGLYPISDSLDFLQHSPTYFTTANDSGDFSMSYIKTGSYKILAFKDENRNLILDPKEEDHAFKADTIVLRDSIESITLSSVLQNVQPIQLINNRPIRSYHEIKLSREIDDYSIEPDSIFSSITGEENDVIRLYNPEQFIFGDSIQIKLFVSDSLGNEINDTLKVVFNESNITPPEFTESLAYKESKFITNPLYTINFNKPVNKVDLSKINYRSDSTFTYPPDSLSLEWNQNKTEVSIQAFVNKDSIYQDQIRNISLDSTKLKVLDIDSVEFLSSNQIDSLKRIIASKTPIELNIDPGAFISVDTDSSKLITHTHRKDFAQAFGTLQFNINTDKPSFIVQLLNNQKEVAYELKNELSPLFVVRPATYKIRILIDTNNDGKWSFGNLLQNIQPEEVYLFPQPISIRENWIVGEDIEISF